MLLLIIVSLYQQMSTNNQIARVSCQGKLSCTNQSVFENTSTNLIESGAGINDSHTELSAVQYIQYIMM